MFKKFIAAALTLSCALALCGSMAKSKAEGGISLPIIMYHHISTAPERCGDYVVSPETLEGDFKYLSENGYTAISLKQLLAYVNGEYALPEKSVMISFDDGQESFGVYALPLLEKYNMCAVMAIVGRFTDFYTEFEDHNIAYSYFSWSDLRELVKSPRVELSVHTYDMHDMGSRRGCKINAGESKENYTAAFSADLERVERCFVSALGEKPCAFAYPYGLYCEEAKEILMARGYKIMFTCDQAVNTLTGDPNELLSLGRFNRPNSAERIGFFNKLGIKQG
ncbi:MAG: polysaccharide deacetylase family protein [Oscillospiraceae bacterium]